MQEPLKPSKQFIIRGSIAFGIVIIILISQSVWFKKLIQKKPKGSTTTDTTTIGDVITQDTNGNSIPDWEEKLWGLDPTVLYTNGVSNKQLIEDKKKALGVSDTPSTPLSETDRLARELFILTNALNQTQNVDDATLKAIAAKLGDSIQKKQVINTYALANIRTTPTTARSLSTYYRAMSTTIEKYDTTVADIDVIITALETGERDRLSELSQTTTLYKTISASLLLIPAPIGVAEYHLAIINSFSGIADSFSYIQELDQNGLASLNGIVIYKTHNTRLSNALINMRDYLTRYGILN